MKTIATIISILILLPEITNAQNKSEGIINYEFTLNVHASLTKDQLIYKSLIPEKMKCSVKLYYKNGSSRTEISEPLKAKDSQSAISVPLTKNDEIVRNDKKCYYTIYKNGTNTYYTENKIVTASVITDKKSTKKILGYTCYKVTYKSSENELYEIWVTDDLKTACNPMEAGIVNGTALEINSKKLNYRATKIEFKTQSPSLFELPAKCKKITNAQAEDLEEQMEEDATN